MNRLTGMRCYLCGAMELEPDNGVQWRARMGEWLAQEHGVVVLDPTNKPIDLGREDLEDRAHRQELKRSRQYDLIAKEMRQIRVVDLRMVDICDFLVVYLDRRVQTCGTWEEVFLANREKKPILVFQEQGKEEAPDWLFGTIDHRYIYSSWDELKSDLNRIASAPILDTVRDKRWMFFHPIIHNKSQQATYL